MKVNRSILLTRLAGILLILPVTSLDIYLFNSGLVPIPPTVGWTVSSAVIILLAFIQHGKTGLRRQISVASQNVPFLLLFMGIATLSLMLSVLPDANYGSGNIYLFLPTFSFFVFAIALVAGSLNGFQRAIRPIAATALVLLCLSIFADILSPGTFSRALARAAGFAENPNSAAFRAVLLCSVAITYQQIGTRNLLLLGLTGLATLATLSRGGMLLLTLLVLCFLISVSRNKGLSWVSVFKVGVAAGIVLLSVNLGAQFAFNQFAAEDKYIAAARFGKLSGEQALYSSNEGRMQLTKFFIAKIADKPLAGYGTGYSFSVSIVGSDQGPHNMYVRQWVDNGVLGMILYLAMLITAIAIFRKRNSPSGVTFILLVAAASIFSHNVLENRSFLILFGLLAAMSVARLPEVDSRTKTQPSH